MPTTAVKLQASSRYAYHKNNLVYLLAARVSIRRRSSSTLDGLFSMGSTDEIKEMESGSKA